MNGGQQELINGLSKSSLVDCGYFALAAEEVLRAGCRGLAVARGGVWLMSKDGGRLDGAVALIDEVVQDGLVPSIGSGRCPSFFAALREDRVLSFGVGCPQAALTELIDSAAVPAEVCALIAVPLRIQGSLVGMLALAAIGEPRAWSNDDAGFCAALGEVAARALVAETRMVAQDELILAHASLERQVAERTRSLKLALERLEETRSQLVESEKLSALGRLVAGVAHEVNTPVGIAVTAASHLQNVAADTQARYQRGTLDEAGFRAFLMEAQESADLVLRNLGRAAQLVQSFKRIAVEQNDERLSRFSLAALLEDLVASLRPACRRAGVACSLECPAGIELHSYPGALSQIVTNLVMNALNHAFDRGPDPSHRVSVAAHAEDSWAVIEVADNGQGIAEEIRERLFEPFATTKRGAGGTGLGLHVSYNLAVRRLQGSLGAIPSQPRGALFRVRVPLQVAA